MSECLRKYLYNMEHFCYSSISLTLGNSFKGWLDVKRRLCCSAGQEINEEYGVVCWLKGD